MNSRKKKIVWRFEKNRVFRTKKNRDLVSYKMKWNVCFCSRRDVCVLDVLGCAISRLVSRCYICTSCLMISSLGQNWAHTQKKEGGWDCIARCCCSHSFTKGGEHHLPPPAWNPLYVMSRGYWVGFLPPAASWMNQFEWRVVRWIDDSSREECLRRKSWLVS